MRFALVALVACGNRVPIGTPSPLDWSRPPHVEPTRFIAPSIARWSLANGLRVLLVEDHHLPMISVATVHTSAGSREDGAHPGQAALTADLLDEGAGERSAHELADALDREGARLETDIATDAATVELVALSDHAAASLALLADVIERPRFAAEDFARVRARRIAELARHRERPRTIAAQLFDRLIYGAHPYAHPAEGTPEAVAAVTPADVAAFWRRAYGPTTTTIIVVGDVARPIAEHLIGDAFGAWNNPDAVSPPPPPLPPSAPVLAYVDAPGADQTIVMIGGRARVTDPVPADVANLVFGGDATSRLERRLRTLTTGAGSALWRGDHFGSWAIATNMTPHATAESIRAALDELAAMRAREPAADELAHAKAVLVDTTTRRFDTRIGATRALERLVAHHLPDDDYATITDRIAAVTPAEVRAAAAEWTEVTIVVVGDWAAIGESLRALGLPLAHYTADGSLMR